MEIEEHFSRKSSDVISPYDIRNFCENSPDILERTCMYLQIIKRLKLQLGYAFTLQEMLENASWVEVYRASIEKTAQSPLQMENIYLFYLAGRYDQKQLFFDMAKEVYQLEKQAFFEIIGDMNTPRGLLMHAADSHCDDTLFYKQMLAWSVELFNTTCIDCVIRAPPMDDSESNFGPVFRNLLLLKNTLARLAGQPLHFFFEMRTLEQAKYGVALLEEPRYQNRNAAIMLSDMRLCTAILLKRLNKTVN